MKNFLKYFYYRFRETWIALPLISLIMVIFIHPTISSYVSDYMEKINHYDNVKADSGIPLITGLLLLLVLIIPIIEFNCLNSKRNNDMIFSMPFSRTSILFGHWFNGLLQIIIPFTVTFIVALTLWLQIPDAYSFPNIFRFYGTALLLAACIYTFYCLIFINGNTTADGVVFCFFWTFLPLVACLIITTNIENYQSGIFIPPFALMNFADAIDKLVTKSRVTITEEIQFDVDTLPFIWLGIGILCAILMYLYFNKKRLEATGDISEAIIGYKPIIPFFGIGVPYVFSGLSAITTFVIIFDIIAMIIGFIMYRRGTHFDRKDIV